MDLQKRFLVDQKVDVYVTHVHDESGHFYMQINNDEAGKLDELMEEIDQFITSGQSQSLSAEDVDIGAVYLAQYSVDAKWYRARVVAVKPTGVCDVHFIDYGNTEQIPVKFVRHVQPAFLRLHPQAFECELDGMSNFQGPSLKSAISTMSSLILEQQLVGVTSAIDGEILTLKLYTDSSCSSSILDSLLSQVQRTPQSSLTTTSPSTSNDRKYATLDLSTDSYLDFHVSNVQDPFNFCCQLLEEIPKILELLEELAEEYSDQDVPLLSSSLGYPCCAKFYEDDCWYRGVITNSSAVASGTVDVKFVDYGNSQTTSLKDVKGLKDKYLEIPIQAVECSLHGIRPSGNSTEWSSQAKELFSKLTSEKHIIAQICGRDTNGKYQVQLIDMTGDTEMQLDQILIAAKYAEKVGNSLLTSSTGPVSKVSTTQAPATTPAPKVTFPFATEVISPGKQEKVLVASVTSPSSFYCMLYRTSTNLEKLMADLARHYSGLGRDDEWLSSPSVGDPCCARFSEDKSWYRAVVKEVHSSGKVKVQFVDYGNYDTIVPKDVKRLAPQFSELPCQAIECTMHRICPNGQDWKHADIKKFEDIALEYSGNLMVISENDDGVKNVELVITLKGKEINVAEAMLVSGNARLAEGAVTQTENLASVSSKKFAKLNLPLGTYEDIFVTHVEDPANFWCQLVKHKDELDAVMNAVEEHCSSSSSPLKSPSLELACCAQYSDGAWYRASVTGVLKNHQVEVHFVDFGNYDTVSQSNLRPMKPELMNLPAQSFKCCLEQIDIKNTPQFSDEVIDKFTDFTVDKELVGMISSYDSSSQQYLISCTDTSGGNTLDIYEQIASHLPPSSIKEYTVPKQDLKVGRREHVCVTSVTGLSHFYCQLMRTANQLDNLMVSIDEHYAKLTANQEEMTRLQAGDYCVARYTEDESWYRAKIIDVKPNSQISVHYIDFGNGEDVTVKSVKRLSQSFSQLPEQVIKCCLAGEITGLSDSQFVELTLDKEFDMEIVAADDKGVAIVNLYTRDTKQPVIQLLTREKPKAPVTIQQTSLSVGIKETVVVSFAKDVSKFYVQASKSADSLAEIMDLIHEHYSNLTEEQDTVNEPQIDMFCVANFSEDDGWYRAKVTAVHGNSVEVFYVDYGNSEVLPVSRIKTLKPDFANLPLQAVQCELTGVHGSNKDEISSKFLKIVEDPEMPFDLHVVNVHTGNVHEAVLINKETGEAVNDEFGSSQAAPTQSKAAGPAKLNAIPLTTGQTYNGQCGAATSPSQFWFSLNSYVDDLNNLLDSLAEYYSSLGPSDDILPSPTVDSCCCCQYSEDQGWYRAKVVSINGSQAEVLFVDFGNSEIVDLNALKVLKQEFQTLPEQAIKCSLNKVKPSNNNTWTDEAKAEFIDVVLEKDAAIRLVQKQPDGTHIVDLLDADGKEFALNVLASKGFVADPSQKALSRDFKPFVMSFDVGDFIDVNPSYSKTPDDFSCQVLTENNIIAFSQMTSKLQEVYSALNSSDSTMDSLSVDMPCCAFYTVDNTWNRAKIIQVINGDTVQVKFVDYGNEETIPISQVKQLQSEFLDLPVQSVQCCISCIRPTSGPSWSESAVQRFLNLVDQKYLVAKVISKDVTKVSLDLYDTQDDDIDINIAQVLVNENHAVSTTLQPPPTEQKSIPTPQPSKPTTPTAYLKLSQLSQLQPSSGDIVYITAVDSPESIFCQLSGTEERIDNLMANLKDFCESGQALPVHAISPNELCLALFSEDNTWYRAVAEEVSPEEIVVRFVDYGNTDTITLDSLRTFDSQFLTEQVLAVECKLAGVKPVSGNGEWSAEAVDFLLNAGGDNGFAISVVSTTSDLEVTLSDQNGDLSQRLISEGLARSSQREPAAPVSAASQPSTDVSYQYPVVNEGKMMEVYITDITSPGQFYCQLADYGNSLDEMMDNINTHYSSVDKSSGRVTSPRVGHPCVAVFDDDNMWYRARIETRSNNGVTIRFIDYGNTQQAQASDLKEIDSQFLQLPVLAVECTIGGQKSLWTAEEIEEFKTLTGEEKLTVEVTGQEGGQYVVRVLQDGKCVTDSLLQQTAVRQEIPTQVLQPNQTEDVYVVFAKSSSEICVQLSSYSDQIDQVMATIEHACESNTTSLQADQVTPGTPCCAFFEDAWYRAIVTAAPSQGQVAVEYVDYGNTASVPLSELRSIPKSCIALPRQAIHCVLDGAGLEAVSKDTLENTLMDTPLTATFIKPNGNQWIVQLKQDNVDVIDVLLINTEVTVKDISFVDPVVVAGSSAQGYVSFIVSPGEFYIQKTSVTEDLEKLDSRLNQIYGEAGSTYQHPKIEAGSICSALYSQDGRWYRALITAVLDNSQVQVLFVDHGNTDVVPTTNVAVLQEEFISLPILAIKCCLGKPGSLWTDDNLSKFEALVMDQELTVEFTEQHGDYWVVNLMYQDTSVLSLIKVGDGKKLEKVPQNLTIKQKEITQGQILKGSLIYADEVDGVYYLSAKDGNSSNKSVEEILRVTYPSLGPFEMHLQNCQVGSYCCVFSENSWYRAKITKILPDNKARLVLVDSGEPRIVAIPSLKQLLPELCEIPWGVIPCTLAGFEMADVEAMEVQMLDMDLMVKFLKPNEIGWSVDVEVVHCGKKTPLEGLVKVFSGKGNSMVDAVFALMPQPFTCAKLATDRTEDVKFLMAESDRTIWLQPVATENDLVTLMHSIAENPPSQPMPVSEIIKTKACLCKFTEDDEWYRAEVVETKDGQVTVKYVDYGNTETVEPSRVSAIQGSLISLPAQAIKCCLHGVSSLTEELINKLNEEYLEVQLKAEVVEQKDSIYSIKLFDSDGQDLITKLSGVTGDETQDQPATVDVQAKMLSFTWATLSSDQTEDVKFLVAERDNTIWLQPVATENDLVTLMHSIAENPPSEPMPVSEITKTKPCLCKFTEDDEWYRAEIVETKDGQVTVKYVDYGNTETVEISRVSAIQSSLISLPAQAIKCCLHGESSLTEELINKLNEEYVEVQLKAEVVEQKGNVYFIKLYEADGKEMISNLTEVTNGETTKEPVAVVRQRSLDDQQVISEITTGNEQDNKKDAKQNTEVIENEPDSKGSYSQTVEATTEPDSPEETVVSENAESSESTQPLSQENIESKSRNHIDTDLTVEELAYFTQELERLRKIEQESSQISQQTPSLVVAEQNAAIAERCTTSSRMQTSEGVSHTEIVPHTEINTLENNSSDESEISHLKNESIDETESDQLQSESTNSKNILEPNELTCMSNELSSALQNDVQVVVTKSAVENDINLEEDMKDLNQGMGKKAGTEVIVESNVLKQDKDVDLDIQETESNMQSGISSQEKEDLQGVEKKVQAGSSVENSASTEDKELNQDNQKPDETACSLQNDSSFGGQEDLVQGSETKDEVGSVMKNGAITEDKELNQDNQKEGETVCSVQSGLSAENNDDLSHDLDTKDEVLSVMKNSVFTEDKELNQNNQNADETACSLQNDSSLDDQEDLIQGVETKDEVGSVVKNGVITEDKELNQDNQKEGEIVCSVQSVISAENNGDLSQDIEKKCSTEGSTENCVLKEEKEMNQDSLKAEVTTDNAGSDAQENKDLTQDNNSGDVVDQIKQNGSSEGNNVHYDNAKCVDGSKFDKDKAAVEIPTQLEVERPHQNLTQSVGCRDSSAENKDSTPSVPNDCIDDAPSCSQSQGYDANGGVNAEDIGAPRVEADVNDSESTISKVEADANGTASITPKEEVDANDSASITTKVEADADDSASITPKEEVDANDSALTAPKVEADANDSASITPKEEADANGTVSTTSKVEVDVNDSASITPKEEADANDSASITPKEEVDANDSASITPKEEADDAKYSDFTSPKGEAEVNHSEFIAPGTEAAKCQSDDDGGVVLSDQSQEQPNLVPGKDKESKEKISESVQEDKKTEVNERKDEEFENKLSIPKDVEKCEGISMNGKHQLEECMGDDVNEAKGDQKVTNGHVNGHQELAPTKDADLPKADVSGNVDEKKTSCKPM